MCQWPKRNLKPVSQVLDRDNYTGYDPYDGLASPLTRFIPWAKARLIFTHLVRKSPFNIRPLLGIPKTLNPKTLALALMVKARIEDESACLKLIQMIEKTQPWGYPFAWQSRAFFVPVGTPTAVNTAFVLHALADARDIMGIDAKSVAIPAVQRITENLNQQDGFFSYTPIDNHRVHNANLLLASALARWGRQELAEKSALASLCFQREDGSLLYGEDHDFFAYIDNFHTGFVLLALNSLNRSLNDRFKGQTRALARFYKTRLFTRKGSPLWRLNKPWPKDIHNHAVAAGTLADLGETQWALRVLREMENLFVLKGFRFGYQRGRLLFRKQNYIRWGQAWAGWAYAAVVFGYGLGPEPEAQHQG